MYICTVYSVYSEGKTNTVLDFKDTITFHHATSPDDFHGYELIIILTVPYLHKYT